MRHISVSAVFCAWTPRSFTRVGITPMLISWACNVSGDAKKQDALWVFECFGAAKWSCELWNRCVFAIIYATLWLLLDSWIKRMLYLQFCFVTCLVVCYLISSHLILKIQKSLDHKCKWKMNCINWHLSWVSCRSKHSPNSFSLLRHAPAWNHPRNDSLADSGRSHRDRKCYLAQKWIFAPSHIRMVQHVYANLTKMQIKLTSINVLMYACMQHTFWPDSTVSVIASLTAAIWLALSHTILSHYQLAVVSFPMNAAKAWKNLLEHRQDGRNCSQGPRYPGEERGGGKKQRRSRQKGGEPRGSDKKTGMRQRHKSIWEN